MSDVRFCLAADDECINHCGDGPCKQEALCHRTVAVNAVWPSESVKVRWKWQTPPQVTQDKMDAERFKWYFGPDSKAAFLPAYLEGLRENFTVDQWRAAIDAARSVAKDQP